MPGPETELTPASAASIADPNVSAPAWASSVFASESAMYDWVGRPSDLATAT